MSTNKKSNVTKTLPVIKKNEKQSATSDANKKSVTKNATTSNKLPEISPLKQNKKSEIKDPITSSTTATNDTPSPVETPSSTTSTPVETIEILQLTEVFEPVIDLAAKVADIYVSNMPIAPPLLPINGNGKVTLIYEQYNEQFDIHEGVTTHENIDEVYCLSFVMPNCLIHLSIHSPDKKRILEAEGSLEDLFVKEDPRGTYHTLEADSTYYVYVEQEADQLARDQERMRLIALSMEGGGARTSGDGIVRDDGRVMESCSCIYGNPCVDEYGCKDWSNRAAVALKNGWKGF